MPHQDSASPSTRTEPAEPDSNATMPSPGSPDPAATRHWPAGLAALYVLAVLILFASAGRILGLQCETFSCTGEGLAWMLWTGSFAAVLALGTVTIQRLSPQGLSRRIARITRTAQWLSGAVLFIVWLFQ